MRVTYLDKPVSKINIGDFAKILQKTAIENRTVAAELAEEGVRQNVTPRVVRQVTDYKGMSLFGPKGHLTKIGRKLFLEHFAEMGMKDPKKTTIREYLKKILEIEAERAKSLDTVA